MNSYRILDMSCVLVAGVTCISHVGIGYMPPPESH